MARKIRFPLKMTNGTEVRTIEELRADFDLTAVLGYYADGKLVTWLRDRYLDSEADKIEALDKDSKSFQNDLCAALGVEAPSSPDEAGGEYDMDYINRRNEKKRILRTITDDEEIIYKVDQVALDQDDLLDIYDEGKKEIYLCQGEFEIPLSVTDVTYIGVADPIVTVRVTDNVNFKEKNIKFVDCVYGWDVSNTSPLDNMKRAEHLFLKGDYQKAADTLQNYAEQGNPRAILLLCDIYWLYLKDIKKYDYWDERSKQSSEAKNTSRNTNSKDESGKKRCLPPLKKLAEKGDSFDLYYYACALRAAKDDSALKYYRLSAEKGNILAMDKLGIMLSTIIKIDDAEKNKWLKKSAELGSIFAQYQLGFNYSLKIGIEDDDNAEDKAIEWYTKAAMRGYIDAQNGIGDCYRYTDSNKAIEWYTMAADQGDDRAMYNIGYCYEHELYDEDTAFKWYLKSAEKGNSEAQHTLGDMYYNGRGTDIDYEKAVKWYTKSLENFDSPDVQLSLGYCYYYGNGVEENEEKAFELFQKAAEWRDEAVGLLGDCFYNGYGTEQNYTEAVNCYTKIAEENPNAQNILGDCYYYGRGVEQSYEKAVEWYVKAANSGHSGAQYNLGYCYYHGEGITQDTDFAIDWLTKSSDQGNENSKNLLIQIDTERMIEQTNAECDRAIAEADEALANLNNLLKFL